MKLFFSKKAFDNAIENVVKDSVKASLQKALPQIAPNRFLYPLANTIGNTLYPGWDAQKPIQAAVTSVDVYSVISRIAQTTAAVPFIKYKKTTDKNSFKLYQQKSYNDLTKMLYRVKALEELPEKDDLNQLFYAPNGELTEREFLETLCFLYLADGEVNIYKRKTGKSRGSKVVSMHVFAKSDTAIVVSGLFPYAITGYNFTYNGEPILNGVPTEDVIHIKNPNPNYKKDGSHLRGLSPLSVGRKLIESIDVAEQRRYSGIKNGSLPGIIYLEEGTDAPEWDQWRREYQTFIENAANDGAPMPISGKAGYIATGLRSVDMQLLENANLNFKKLCNLYHISTILFNSDVAATESNVQEMIKLLYTNACMPLADVFQDAFNRDKDIMPDNSKYVAFDFTAVPALQQDMMKLMQAVGAMPVSLSGNQIFELWGYEKSDLPEMDKPLLKQGYGFIDDHIILPDPNSNLNV